MSATSNEEERTESRASTAEEACTRHGDVYRRWAEEDTRRGRLARSILRVGGELDDD